MVEALLFNELIIGGRFLRGSLADRLNLFNDVRAAVKAVFGMVYGIAYVLTPNVQYLVCLVEL